jgi:hypothetical protein
MVLFVLDLLLVPGIMFILIQVCLVMARRALN